MDYTSSWSCFELEKRVKLKKSQSFDWDFFNSETTFNLVIHNQLCVSCCFDCKSTKNLRAIHNCHRSGLPFIGLFRLQKYKKFESNSQRTRRGLYGNNCCFDCKSTKNLRAIHNMGVMLRTSTNVVSTAKVQKI